MRCFLIWFSNQPSLFINQINRQRLINLRNASNIDISLVTYKKILNESAIIDLENFSKSQRIDVIDLEALKNDESLSSEYRCWQNIMVEEALEELELWCQNKSGNPAVASDLIRFCPSLLTSESFYIDFDINLKNILAINRALSNKKNEFSFLLNYQMVGTTIKNRNNNILYFSKKRIDLRDWVIKLIVEKIQFPSLFKSEKRASEDLSPTEKLYFENDARLYHLRDTPPLALLNGTFNQDYINIIVDSYGPSLIGKLLKKIIDDFSFDPSLRQELNKNRYELITEIPIEHNDFSWHSTGKWIAFLNGLSAKEAKIKKEKAAVVIKQSNHLFNKIKENFFTKDELLFESINYLNSTTLGLLKNAAFEFRGILMLELTEYLMQEAEPSFEVFIHRVMNKKSSFCNAGKNMTYQEIFSQQPEDFGMHHLSKNLADFFLRPIDKNKPYFVDEIYRLAGLVKPQFNRNITNTDREYFIKIYSEFLIQICFTDKYDLFYELLEKGADVNYMNNQYSPLIIGCALGKIDMVKELLIRGAQVNLPTANNNTPLSVACQKNFPDIARLLIVNGADVNLANSAGVTPLGFVCRKGYYELAAILLEAKANVDQAMKNGVTPLYFACQNGHLNLVILLLQYQPNIAVIVNETTAVHAACKNNHIDIVRLLIKEGMSIKQTKATPITPLMFACENGNFEIVKFLLEYDADMEAALSDGQTALHLACNAGHFEITQLLLQSSSAQINALTHEGATPLMLACNSKATKENRAIFNLLLNNNADLTLFANVGKGQSSLDIAFKTQNQAAIVELLTKANEQNLSLKEISSPKTHQLAYEWANSIQMKMNDSNQNKLTFFSNYINFESTSMQKKLSGLTHWVIEQLSLSTAAVHGEARASSPR